MSTVPVADFLPRLPVDPVTLTVTGIDAVSFSSPSLTRYKIQDIY